VNPYDNPDEMALYAKLPHDDYYDDWTWSHILGDDRWSGPYDGTDDFDPTQVAEVELWHVTDDGWGPEHSAAGLFRMNDGTFVVYTGWCDTTGWGCQDDARFTFHPTRDHAVRFGFGNTEREWFGLELR